MTDFFSRVRNISGGRPASHTDTPSLPLAPPVSLDSAESPARTPSAEVSAGGGGLHDDFLGVTPYISRLADWLTLKTSHGPLTAGIFGGPGSGKTFALDRLLAGIARLSATPGQTRYVNRIITARVDARLGGEAATRIASAIHAALLQSAAGGRNYAALAQEAAENITDPAEASSKAHERLTAARRQLDAERQALLDITGKQNRVVETILYEAQGSRVDSFARANRSMIENRLRSFGFLSGDPVATYKDLVREIGERGGVTGRIGAFFRALWAFRGQMRLIILAIFFALIAWGAGLAQETREVWLAPLRGMDSLKSVTAWIEANIGLLGLIRQASIWAAIAALAFNVFRAFRFLSPIWRGAGFMRDDIETRKRELDALVANQTRRVDDMTKETETLAAQSSAAEKRAQSSVGKSLLAARLSPFSSDPTGVSSRAEGFLATLAEHAGKANPEAPQRIIVAIDNIEDLPGQEALTFANRAQSLLTAPCYGLIFTGDPARLQHASGLLEQLQRVIQTPLMLPSPAQGYRAVVAAMLGRKTEESPSNPPAANAALDTPLNDHEADLLEALAPLAGHSPRDIKRFVTLYRLARPDVENFAPLALAMALQTGGSAQELASIASQLTTRGEDVEISGESSPRLEAAVQATSSAQAGPIRIGQLRAAQAVTAIWSMKS